MSEAILGVVARKIYPRFALLGVGNVIYAADTMRHDGDNARHDGDNARHDGNTTDKHRVPVIEAAGMLGITPDAVRARLRRGTLPKEEGPDGETLVVLDADTMRQVDDTTTDTTALVESLLEQVSYLKETVAKRDEEIRRRDHLLAAALERIPAIEAPPDTPSDSRESPVSASDEAGDAGVPSEPERPVSWWRRLFGT